MKTIKKIVVIGPESTGKSTLCKELAAHYNTLWVPEYAREYLEKNGPEYNYADLLTIAKGQIELEEAVSNQQLIISNQQKSISDEQPAPDIRHQTSDILHQSRLLFIDTDMYVMKVWCEFVFNKCHNWILNQIAERKYDLYLLCNVDLPWVKDTLREYPDKNTRERLYSIYKDIMLNQSAPWSTISGNYEERFNMAIEFIDAQLPKELL